MKIFRTMLCTLCQNYLIFYNMQLCGFHCIKGYSICILAIFPCIFINYCDYRVNHREFLWLVVASQYQMSSDINILYHNWLYYQEWLKYQTFTAFQYIFHIFGYMSFPAKAMVFHHFLCQSFNSSISSSVEAYLL